MDSVKDIGTDRERMKNQFNKLMNLQPHGLTIIVHSHYLALNAHRRQTNLISMQFQKALLSKKGSAKVIAESEPCQSKWPGFKAPDGRRRQYGFPRQLSALKVLCHPRKNLNPLKNMDLFD